jgi:hypothetical protein
VIEGNIVIFKDAKIDDFIGALDQQFSSWEENDLTKKGKI